MEPPSPLQVASQHRQESVQGHDVVLEGYMLKQASYLTKKYWHDRYFVFRADNTLEYYKSRDDEKCKASFHISNVTGCEVSELFVRKHKNKKNLVYCIRLTFSKLEYDGNRPSGYFNADDDTSSSIGESTRCDASRASIDTDSRHRTSTDVGGDIASPKSTRSLSSAKKPPGNKRSLSYGSAIKVKTPPESSVRSVDAESLSFGSRLRRRPRRGVFSTTSNGGGGGNIDDVAPEVPQLVEVNQRRATLPPSLQLAIRGKHQRDSTASNGDTISALTPVISNNHRSRTAYEEEQEEEQDYLRTQYLTTQERNKRRTKEKLVQGTKLAAAAGAAITVTVFTAGMAGLIALGVASAAGGGGVAAVSATWRRKDADGWGEIVMACADYETAKRWKSVFDAALESDSVHKSTWGQLFASDGRKARAALLPNSQPVSKREMSQGSFTCGIGGGLNFARNARWTLIEGGLLSVVGSGFQGLRIYREERNEDRCGLTDDHCGGSKTSSAGRRLVYTQLSVDGKPCPPMKAHTVLSTSPLDAFLCLMSHGRVMSTSTDYDTPETEHRVSFEVIESIDEHTDVIHLVFRPLFLFPSWTTSRDFVLYRYWRLEQDGCYVVCYESVEHSKCPPSPDHVRGEMHSVFNIAPQKKSLRKRAMNKNQPMECLMTATVQVDPKGWVPSVHWSCLSNQAYGDAFGIAALLQLVDIRDAIDLDRFVAVASDSDLRSPIQPATVDDFPPFDIGASSSPPDISRNVSVDTNDDTLNEDFANYDFAYAGNESIMDSPGETATGISARPAPLTTALWAEPDPNSFRVRGSEYKHDKKKCNAGPSIGRLIAVDVVSVDRPVYRGFAVHPTERIQLALQKEKELKAKGLESDMPPFIFVVNIALPGPPFYHGVYYYAIDDMSTIDGSDGTPSSKLCSKFFFGSSDEFRDRTFKLIPQIVQGNFIVRKAVGSTPAIMGKKLRQLYVKGDRFFEVVLDCGSSPVAIGVIRLSLGYAKSLVVDMGFLFEGDEDEFLPERIFGCVRMKNVDFGPRLRHVMTPSDETEQ